MGNWCSTFCRSVVWSPHCPRVRFILSQSLDCGACQGLLLPPRSDPCFNCNQFVAHNVQTWGPQHTLSVAPGFRLSTAPAVRTVPPESSKTKSSHRRIPLPVARAELRPQTSCTMRLASPDSKGLWLTRRGTFEDSVPALEASLSGTAPRMFAVSRDSHQ